MKIGRMRALSLIDGAEKGNVFFQQHVCLVSLLSFPTSKTSILTYIPCSTAPSLQPTSHIKQHYYKAHAYRVTPHTTASISKSKASHNWLSIDGEHYQLTPGQPFTVECHYALGALLSPTPGLYAHAEVFEKAAAEALTSKSK